MSDVAKKKSERLDVKLKVDSQFNVFEHQLVIQTLVQVLVGEG